MDRYSPPHFVEERECREEKWTQLLRIPAEEAGSLISPAATGLPARSHQSRDHLLRCDVKKGLKRVRDHESHWLRCKICFVPSSALQRSRSLASQSKQLVLHYQHSPILGNFVGSHVPLQHWGQEAEATKGV